MAEKQKKPYRWEEDSMGPVKIPTEAYYGAQTQRAVENFPVSSLRFSRQFIKIVGLIKWAAARVNHSLGLLDKKTTQVIEMAAWEVREGKMDGEFVVDIFQTGSGTSTNMNANEVIANRANEMLGEERGTKDPVHPNDHVNLGQSSNDIFPSILHIAAAEKITQNLIPTLEIFHRSLLKKAKELDRIIKTGRTHLQDATPVRMGQEFRGYARQIEQGINRLRFSLDGLAELALGGTAVGTGLNTHKDFAERVITMINREIGFEFCKAENHFEAQSSKDAIVFASGALKTLAVSLAKMADDIRWMGSGPRGGLAEIILPPTQPGSSIMPGKVNPVIAESLIQVCAQVIGNDTTITICGLSGNFELNTMMPVIGYNLLQSIDILNNAVANFRKKCLEGIVANVEHCQQIVSQNLTLCTALTPLIGYDQAARIAKKSYETGKTILEIALEDKILPEEKLAIILNPRKMT